MVREFHTNETLCGASFREGCACDGHGKWGFPWRCLAWSFKVLIMLVHTTCLVMGGVGCDLGQYQPA
jgi:hypothetical protein